MIRSQVLQARRLVARDLAEVFCLTLASGVDLPGLPETENALILQMGRLHVNVGSA